MLPVPRFFRRIGLVLMRRCGKNFAVAGYGFFGYFLPRVPLFGLVFGVTTSVKVQDYYVRYGGGCRRQHIIVRKTPTPNRIVTPPLVSIF